MRVVPCVILLFTVGLTGCQSLFKRPGDARNSAGAAIKAPAKFPGGNEPLIGKGPAEASELGGLIAGYVIDKYNDHPRNAYIRWVSAEEPVDKEAPIDVAVNPQGYFTIRGLKPDHRYKLVARAKDGDKMIAGITYTSTPNIHVLIRLSEEMATAEVPPVPGSPALADARPQPPAAPAKEAKPEEPSKEIPASANIPSWEPARSGPPDAPPGMRIASPPATETTHSPPPAPLSISDLPPPSAPPPGAETPGWIPGVARQSTNWPPTMHVPATQDVAPVTIRIEKPLPLETETELPAVRPLSPAAATIPLPPPPLAAERQSTPTTVPSCVLLGKKLVNFALYDLNGQPWEFRTHHRGKLVLIDFWGTKCLPCIESIPYLRKLHNDFGPSGLEVVGIGYEMGSAHPAPTAQLRQLAQKHQANYLQLQGAGSDCPVSRQFGVTALPTIVLVDENGWILWRHVGMLDAYRHQELELLVRQKLDVQRQ